MAILKYDKKARIVRIAPTREDLNHHTNEQTLYEITSIKQGREGLAGKSWFCLYSHTLLVGTCSDIIEVIEEK